MEREEDTGSVGGKAGGRGKKREEAALPATARVSSDASPHLSVRI